MVSSRPCRLFLFDLDGTLVDSREDIARAVNSVLSKLELPPLSMEEVLRFVGDGVEVLIQRALREIRHEEPDEALIQTGVRLLFEEYSSHLVVSTHLYPGVRETLAALRGAHLGLISNKPEGLSRRILEEFDLAGEFCIVFGGDSLPQRKPAPAPLLEAMSRCQVSPAETVMVGDAPTDILAGKAAGVPTCGVLGGFRSRDDLEAAGADIILERFADLLQHFSPAIPS
jgi:phosphoglycolate phosphatase